MAKQGKKTARALRSTQEADLELLLPIKGKRSSSARKRADEAWSRATSKPLVCKSPAQERYLAAIRGNKLTFGIGPAGTGKSFVAAKFAAMEFDQGVYDGIVFIRPIVEAGGGIGFLPGTADEKTAPYQVPILEVLEGHYGKSHLQNLMYGPHVKIQFIAPEFVRGITLQRKFVLIDEAQNLTPLQMKTLLTRIGEDSKVVINGDTDQVDIKGPSGLIDAQKKLPGLSDISFVEFTEEDIVRSGLVKEILKRYRSYGAFENESSKSSRKT